MINSENAFYRVCSHVTYELLQTWELIWIHIGYKQKLRNIPVHKLPFVHRTESEFFATHNNLA